MAAMLFNFHLGEKKKRACLVDHGMVIPGSLASWHTAFEAGKGRCL